MNTWKTLFTILLGLALSAFVLSPAQAQDVDVIVTPDEAELEPGDGIQLEVFAFTMQNDHRAPVDIQELDWQVEPDSMATISDDGFFIAGRNVGVVSVKVTIKIRNRSIVRRIVIRIGKLHRQHYRLEVVPNAAVVPVGHEKQFEVVFFSGNDRKPVPPERVRWEVKPGRLGEITERGVFTAGDKEKHGRVVAHVEIEGLRLNAAAKIWVSPPATAAISGNITDDPGGAALADAAIRAIRLGRIPWVKRTRSDADGNYLLDNLIPGVYVVTANAKGFIGEFYDNTRNYLEATPLNLAENDTSTNIDFGLSEGGKISGTVLAEPDSTPLVKAHVVAFLVVNRRIAKHVLTDENGDYTVESLPTGSYAVRVNIAGYKGEYYDDAREFADAQFVSVDEPERTPDIDFGLAMTSAISGRVTDASDGSPIARAHVRFWGLAHTSLAARHAVRETRTNENGEYVVQLRPGAYLVHASAEGFNAELYDNARDRSSATPVTVSADSHSTSIDFDLVQRGSIAGTVTDQESGEPIADALVEAFKERATINATSANHARFRAKTDSLGHYLIENVPAGNYMVVSHARSYLPEFYKEAATKQDAELVAVGDSSAVPGIDFTLEQGGAIAGFVGADNDSTPLARALVKIIHRQSGRSLRTFTNEAGEYEVGGLPTGQYLVRFVAEGFVPEFYDNAAHRGDATPVEVTAPETTAGIDAFLAKHTDRRGTVAGRVLSDADDSPLFGAVVLAVSPDRRRPHVTLTGPNGFYRLSDLPAGKYYVFAWAEEFVGEYFDDAFRFKNADLIRLRDNQVRDGVDFGLRPVGQSGVYAIRGRITAKLDGASAEGVLVQAKLDGDIQVNAFTDADGNYVISGLTAGDYKVEATGAGYQDGHFGGSSENTAAPVTVGSGEDAESADIQLEFDNITSVGDDLAVGLPEQFELSQNYPNPFNPETTIKYQLTESGEVTLSVFNLLGQQVRTLVSKPQQAGSHSATWDGKDNSGRQVASGIYVYRLKAGDKFTMSKQMLLLK